MTLHMFVAIGYCVFLCLFVWLAATQKKEYFLKGIVCVFAGGTSLWLGLNTDVGVFQLILLGVAVVMFFVTVSSYLMAKEENASRQTAMK